MGVKLSMKVGRMTRDSKKAIQGLCGVFQNLLMASFAYRYALAIDVMDLYP